VEFAILLDDDRAAVKNEMSGPPLGETSRNSCVLILFEQRPDLAWADRGQRILRA